MLRYVGFSILPLLFSPATVLANPAGAAGDYPTATIVDYVLGCLRLLLAEGHAALDCKQDVHDAYNARIDEGNQGMAWGVATVNSWYRNRKGRVSQNWPFSLLEYWQQTREPEPGDYALT